MSKQLHPTKRPRTRLAAVLAALAVAATTVLAFPAAAQAAPVDALSNQLAVRDSYNRGDISMYTSLIISWRVDTAALGGATVSSFKIEAAPATTDGDGNTVPGTWADVTRWTTVVSTTSGAGYTHHERRHTDLSPGTSNFYRITATLSDGSTSNPVVTRRAASTLSLPTTLAWGAGHKIWAHPGAADPDGSLQVWWNSPSNVPSALWGHLTYTLEAQIAGGSWTEVGSRLSSARYLHTGLESNTTVTYRVTATIDNPVVFWPSVSTAASGTGSATTDLAPPPAAPGKPVVTATPTATSIELSWPAVSYSDPNSSGSVLYTVEGGKVNDAGQITSWQVLSERKTALTYTHAGLTEDDKWRYVVYASVLAADYAGHYVEGPAWSGEATASDSLDSASNAHDSASDSLEPSDGTPLEPSDGERNARTSSVPAQDGIADVPPPTVSSTFYIYYDSSAGSAAASRYSAAKTLLDEAGFSYTEVTGNVYADVLALTGLSKSVVPRFFLGDPTESGWTPQAKVNNGGLRWLKAKVAELNGS